MNHHPTTCPAEKSERTRLTHPGPRPACSARSRHARFLQSLLSGLAASVFTPKPQEQPAERLAAEEGRTGRILPSLLPPNAVARESGPVRKQAKAKRPRKRVVAERQEALQPTEVGSDRAIPSTFAPPERSATATPAVPRGRKNGRRADTRLRAGEGGSVGACRRRAGRRLGRLKLQAIGCRRLGRPGPAMAGALKGCSRRRQAGPDRTQAPRSRRSCSSLCPGVPL
jgi:hypothetical protein